MNLIKGVLLAAGLSILVAAPVAAQQDRDALKKKILREVEEKLRKEEDAILREIERAIDSELTRILKERGQKPAPKAPAQKKPEKKTPQAAPTHEPGFLGVALIELTDDDRADLGVKKGLKVAQVVPNSPAETAGLRADDVVTAINGVAVEGFEQVRETVGKAGAGETLKIEFVRGGKKKTVPVKLAARPGAEPPTAKAPPKKEEGPDDLRERVKKFLEKKERNPRPRVPDAPPAPEGDSFALDPDTFDQFRGILENLGLDPDMLDQLFEEGDDGKFHLAPTLREFLESFDFSQLFKEGGPMAPEAPAPKAPAPARPMRPYIGVQPEEPSPELRAQLGIPEGEGLLVYEVVPGSPAEKAGLRKHDILVKLDGKPVKGEDTLAAFMETAKVGQKVTAVVIRKAREKTLTITVGGRPEE